MTVSRSRRNLLAAGLAVPLVSRTPATRSGPSRLRLPGPTGPYAVGTVNLHLADRSRSYQGRVRELMATVWYPAHRTWSHPLAPWMDAAPFRLLLESADFDPDSVLAPLTAGHNPDVDHRPLPTGLGSALDLRRLGMFGHSKGGTATALLMAEDRRVRAGLILDGPMESNPPPLTDLDRPVMLMTAEFTRAEAPPVAAFWSHLRGWRLNIQADGALHPSYTDYQVLIAELAPIVGLTTEDLHGWIGTLDPGRSVKIQQAYPLAFFDRHLRHRDSRLLHGPSRSFPEVKFLP